jgi:hypothetical protein
MDPGTTGSRASVISEGGESVPFGAVGPDVPGLGAIVKSIEPSVCEDNDSTAAAVSGVKHHVGKVPMTCGDMKKGVCRPKAPLLVSALIHSSQHYGEPGYRNGSTERSKRYINFFIAIAESRSAKIRADDLLRSGGPACPHNYAQKTEPKTCVHQEIIEMPYKRARESKDQNALLMGLNTYHSVTWA